MPGKVMFEPFAVGDQRPIVIEVTPSDDSQVVSATYDIVRRSDGPAVVWNNGGNCIIKKGTLGTFISTPVLITFPTVDIYTVRFSITWDDGQVDNTVSAVIPVTSLPQ